MKITRVSPVSHITRELELDIDDKQYLRLMQGEKIQKVCPHLSENDREFYISGIYGDEWDSLFKEEDM